VADTLPFPQGAFPLVLDSYVSCHFLESTQIERYFNEIRRVTTPHGTIYSSSFSVEDEYYQVAAVPADSEPRVVIDPNNGIAKRLYTEDEIKILFSRYFKFEYFFKFEFSDVVLGRDYRRAVLACVMRNSL
jgi:SAM-dependent methyltransferase